MCGRIAQYKSTQQYANEIGWEEYARSLVFSDLEHYNIPPGTSPYLMHTLDGEPHIEPVFWGYQSSWAKEKKIAPANNATIEKAKSPYWRALWKNGRAIVPADGWYEWTGEKGSKQPWFIRLKTDTPLFMAALTNYRPGREDGAERTGFAVLTAEAFGGMVDVHDRRPIVLSAEDARLWLDLEWSPAQIEQIVRESALPAERFEWYPVGKEVNRSGNEGPQLIVPITLD
jgi:putative SOS response-associated peptidase YedK